MQKNFDFKTEIIPFNPQKKKGDKETHFELTYIKPALSSFIEGIFKKRMRISQ
jgi:hypothetical protein